MKYILSTVVAVAACLGTAYAAGYDDFTRGISANNAGNSDTAIAAFNAALNAGDLNASFVPNAYYGRAVAYLRKGKCAEFRRHWTANR